MRIGIVTTWTERGAAYVSKQYADILREKHNVYIYARGGGTSKEGQNNRGDYTVTWGDRHWAKQKSRKNTKENSTHFKQWVEDNHLDVVFFNEELVWPVVALCHDLKVKTGAYIDYYTKETIPLFGTYDFLICNTKRHFSVFEKRHAQAYYISWGTDVELFKPRTYDLVEPGVLRFFHSSGMNPERKGTDSLLRAFYKISQKYKNCKLIIHTQVSLHEFFPELQTIIEEMTKSGSLICIEKTVSVPGLYHLGDVYVYPTVLEGIGLTIMEALASGLPVIVSDNGPMNEFVGEENGQLVKIKKFRRRYFDHYYWPLCYVDENDLADKMIYYIDNVDKMAEYKRKARLSAQEKIDWRRNAHAIFEAFESSSFIEDKTEALKKIKSLERIKNNFLLRLFYKIKVLKFDIVFVLLDKVRSKIS